MPRHSFNRFLVVVRFEQVAVAVPPASCYGRRKSAALDRPSVQRDTAQQLKGVGASRPEDHPANRKLRYIKHEAWLRDDAAWSAALDPPLLRTNHVG